MDDWRQKFLTSKPWRHMRAHIIDRDKSICQLCGEFVLDTPEVHHKIELTERNYQDDRISLNPELLETLHHECHDKRHKRFGGKEKDMIVGEDLNVDYSKRADALNNQNG